MQIEYTAAEDPVFFCAKNRACGLTICDLTILVDHFKLYL